MFNWFKKLFASKWLKDLLNSILNQLYETLQEIGKEKTELIKLKIKEVNSMQISGTKKIGIVAEYAKSLLPEFGTQVINNVIENLLGNMRKNKEIV